MADNNEELSAEELDALIGDLSSRTDAPASSDDAGDEDIEAFLADLEGDEYQAPPETTKTAEATSDDRVEEFDSLEPPEKAEVAKVPEEAKESSREDKKKKKSKKKDGVRVVEKGGSPGLKLFLVISKWTLLLLPVVLATWIVGAYLGAWVSAGWLIALMSLVLVLGLPGVVLLAVKRGRYIHWLSGLGLLLAVGLVAPLATQAADALARYGHWPVTAVTTPAGLDSDNVFASTSAWASEKLASLLRRGAEGALPIASQLGSDSPLDSDDVPVETVDGAPEESGPEGGASGDEPAPDDGAPGDETGGETGDETGDETEKPGDEPDEPAPADDVESVDEEPKPPAPEAAAPSEPGSTEGAPGNEPAP